MLPHCTTPRSRLHSHLMGRTGSLIASLPQSGFILGGCLLAGGSMRLEWPWPLLMQCPSRARHSQTSWEAGGRHGGLVVDTPRCELNPTVAGSLHCAKPTGPQTCRRAARPHVGSRRPDATHSPRRPRLLDAGRGPLPTPRQQHAEHFVASLRPILELSAESHFKASGRRLLHPAQRLMDLAQAGPVRLSSAGSVLRRVLTQAFSHRLE